METIKLIVAGIVVGIANVIPGVSGGTMAVVFCIYDRLIGVITFNLKKIFSEWKFWLPVACGMGLGIIGFSKVVQFLFEKYPSYTCFFFSGIVAGSIPLIYKSCLKDEESALPSVSVLICALVSFAVMCVMAFYNTESLSSGVLQTVLTPALAVKLVIGGALAAIAMIIPGISGSFLMLILGIYATVIGAVADLNLSILLPAAVGVAGGLFGGAGLVRFLMKKVPFQTYGIILGLVAGSILAVLPIKEFSSIFIAGKQNIILYVVVSLLCFAVGFFVAFSQKIEKKTDSKAE